MTLRAPFAALALLLVALAGVPAEVPVSSKDALADFDGVWAAIDRDYAYFEGGRGPWKRAREAWRPRAAKASTRAELAAALDGLLATLRDEAVELVDRFPGDARRVPDEADVWARWRGNAAVIDSVRIYGDADVAGLKPGDVVISVDGVPIERAVRERLRAGETGAAARDWSLRRVLAGPRTGQMRLEVASGGKRRVALIERRNGIPSPAPPVLARRVGDARDIGYLRVKASLVDRRAVREVDAALTMLSGTRGLILDLREVGNGSSHEATTAILGRFVTEPATWQVREGPGRKREADTVAPRGIPYTAPIVVLVDRWTAGEGEALAAGLHAAAKARLVGTGMAGLRGDPREVRAPHSGLAVRFPAQRALLPDGRPREKLVPSEIVDLSQPQVGAGDPILYRALKLLEPSG